jgi:pyruvate-formate lyase-activating enzyme
MPMQETETKKLLDSISPSFCAAKWYNATIWLGSGMTTSCHHPPAHKIDAEQVKIDPAALHNTEEKKLQRLQMQQGKRPSGCEYCWKLEDVGAQSDRVYKSKIYEAADLLAAKALPHTKNVNLKTLEIAFDRTCNFACSYCNPAFSTTWVKDIKTNGPYQDLTTDGRGHFTHTHDGSQPYKHDETNPYVEAFFRWWESDLYSTLDELRITGGEPLMSPALWRLLDWFKANKGQSKTRIAINTNLCAKPELIDRLIQASYDIEGLDIYTSAEAVGARAEYIRDGMDWAQWTANMERLATEARLRGLHVMATPSVLSIMQLPEFLDWCLAFKQKHGKDFPVFTLNILRFPSFQSVTVLPKQMRGWAARGLGSWLENNSDNYLLHQMEKDHVQRLIDYLNTVDIAHAGASPRKNLQEDLKAFLQQYDQRRKTSIEACPEIKGWLYT